MFRLGNVLVILFILLQIIYCVQGSLRIWRALQAQNRMELYTSRLSELKNDYTKNMSRLVYVRSDRYVEDVARRDLGWTKEGDSVFMVSEKAITK